MYRDSHDCTARYATHRNSRSSPRPWDAAQACAPLSVLQIGMMSEQTIERLHRAFNRLRRLYATMGDDERRLTTTFRQAHLSVHPSVPPFTPPTRNFSNPRSSAN
jgi:hypothetical protein